MKRIFRSIAACLLFAATPALFAHCGGETLLGTETGNPPGIDSYRLYLEQTADGVRVVGGAGAVTPGGAQVTIHNLSTGERIETFAAADGSLDARIAGAPGDEYEVTASSGGRQVTEAISFTRLAERQNLDGVSCEALEATLSESLRETYAGADAACSTDTDCIPVGWTSGAGCYTGCGVALLSTTSSAATNAAALALTAPVCAALDRCDRGPAPSCAGGPAAAVLTCRDGQCQAVDPLAASCEDLELATNSRFRALVDAADRTCSEDSDCGVALPSATCLRTCGYQASIARTAADALTTRIRDEIEELVCGTFVERGCLVEEPPCSPPPPQEAVCRSGECTLQLIELPAE
jgi:hypothetical protein